MLSVIGLEIIVRIGNKTFQLTGQQQFREDISRIVSKVFVGTVTNRHGDKPHLRRRRELQTDGVVGFIFASHSLHSDGLHVVIMMIHEKQSVCEQLSVFIKDDQVIHTCRQKRNIDRDTSATLNGLETLQDPTTQYGNPESLRCPYLNLCRKGAIAIVQMQRTTFLLGFRQVEMIGLTQISKRCLGLSMWYFQTKTAPALILRCYGDRCR